MVERQLSPRTMLAFGAGEAAGAFALIVWGVLLLYFYNQIVGVEAWLVGLAIGLAVAVDAVTDPLIGTWSDRIKTRWGRRHPMLFVSCLPLAASFVLLFNPPAGLTDPQAFAWLLAFGVAVRVSYTFYNIPHLALGAEMAHNYHQRSTLFAYSAFVGSMSVAVCYGVINFHYFPTTDDYDPGTLNPGPYLPMSLHFAVVMLISILLCAAGTRGEIPHLRETQTRQPFNRLTVFREVFAVLRNQSFRVIFLGLLLGSVVGGVESAFTPFLGFHFWNFRTEQLGLLAGVGLVAFPLAFLLTPALTRLLDKKLAVVLPLACWIIAANTPICLRLADVPWFPANDSPWVLVIFLSAATVGAMAAPVIGATANSMLADIADEHELESGLRREGVLYALRAFTTKAANAVGLIFGGTLLSVIEFPKGAAIGTVPAETVWNLGLIAGPATSIFSLLALGFYLRYRIDRRRHGAIVSELSKRRTRAS